MAPTERTVIARIVIVGAGISGLAIAYRLQQRSADAEITVLESNDRPGGTAWTLREDGFQLEIGPNGFLDNKPSTIALCRESDLGGALVEASRESARNRFLFLGNKLHILPSNPGDFLRTRLLSWRGKVNLLLERFRRSAPASSDESIDVFARRRAGKEVAEVFADALVTGIFAGDPKLLSLAACLPRVATLEREHGSVIKGFAAAARLRRQEATAKGVAVRRPGKLWSLREGLRQLGETLAARLKHPPIYGDAVRRLEQKENPGRPIWIVHGARRHEADAVVLTCPAHQQAVLLADIFVPLAEEVAAIPYNRVAVVGLGFRRADVPMALDGFGYIAPQRTRRDVLGVQWCSSIFPDRAPPGAILLRAMCGGWHRAEIVGWDDARLLAAVRAELRSAMGVTAEPIFHKIFRWERAIPQYHVGHARRLERIASHLARLPGLFLGGNAYRGVALNDCAEQGAVMAASVLDYLAAK